ncbi:hypothetical protein [Pandoravirus japonicus]|uniref:DUF5865 domain-containing protein n=1 Tax=Pandoravirus japonicus TaxID=2823154 RepID=A0A811BP12_9VIRU|nr:hypothetical protein [Pandoravirus japonicus]
MSATGIPPAAVQNLADQVGALRQQLDILSTALAGLAVGVQNAQSATVPPTRARPPTFSTLSPYKALPRPLVEGNMSVSYGSAEDDGHMTVTQLLAALRKAPAQATVSMGGSLLPAVLRVYPECHRRRNVGTHLYIYGTVVTATSLVEGVRDEKGACPLFNAIKLGPQPACVDVLIEDLEIYARDAPDAVVLTPSGLASLDSEPNAVTKVVTVMTRRRLDDFLECDLNPFAPCEPVNVMVDAIVARAKAQAASGCLLADIATDLGRAFASGGLAAVDLFYVPAAQTAEEVAAKAGRGSVLTLAEFERAHGRTVADAHIGITYSPVTPGDLSEPVSPLARVLSSGCTNVADLYALLDRQRLAL